MKLTAKAREFLRWLADTNDLPMNDQMVAYARELKSLGLVSFHDHSDGDYIAITPAGRAALKESDDASEYEASLKRLTQGNE